jgi:hypothetical protein
MNENILDNEWLKFQEDGIYENMNNTNIDDDEGKKSPKCSDIYISTQTKIAYLNQQVNLRDIFWKLDIIPYHIPIEGIIKKSMKINSSSPEEVKVLENVLLNDVNMKYDIIQQIDNPNARKIKFKDIRKVESGYCKKDLISYRKKKKGAFYNCFALILRIKYKNIFKEVHVKVFNTGKLEIPGIQEDSLLEHTFRYLNKELQPHLPQKIIINPKFIDTVLINSNFTCNFFINRNIFYNTLKYKYNLHVLFDPCSYPGIQCKFYYNDKKEIQNGVCECKKKCDKKTRICREISFMVFRTGSILIVGHCDIKILNIIYKFLKKILLKEHGDIYIKPEKKIKKNKKKRLKTITIRVN